MPPIPLAEEATTRAVIGAFYDVYNTLDYGFPETLYVSALERELRTRGCDVGREVYVPVTYKNEELGRQRLDMLVNGRVVVEAKATEVLHPMATRQLFSYLRATNLEVGLLLHFGPAPRFRRVVGLNDPHAKVPSIRSV